MLPVIGLYRCSVSVSGTALRLHSHILMLSTAGVGLTVSLRSVGLIIPGGGSQDMMTLVTALLLHVGRGLIPLIFLITRYAWCDMVSLCVM